MHRLTQALKQALDAQLNAATTGNAAAADRHFRFLIGQLAVGTVGLAAFPVWLALDPGGSTISSLAFLWLLAPLATIVFVLKTGRLQLGEAFAALALTGLVSWIALETGGINSPFLVLLAAVPLSVRLSGSGAALRQATVLALAGLALLALLGVAGTAGISDDWLASALSIIAACAAIGLAGFWRTRPLPVEAEDGKPEPPLVDEGGDLITRHGEGGDVIAASRAARELLGIEPDALHGRGMAALVHIEDRPRFDEALQKAHSGDATVRIRYRIEVKATAKPSSEVVETTFRRSDAVHPSRSIIGVTRHATEAGLTGRDGGRAAPPTDGAANGEAQAALSTIIGFADLLADPRLVRTDSQEWRSYAQLVRVSGEQLATLLRGGSGHIAGAPGSGGRLTEMTRRAAELADVASGGCPIEFSANTIDIPTDVPSDECTRVILDLFLSLRRCVPAEGRLVVAIEASETRARLTITAVAMQPFVQGKSTYNGPASIVDLGLKESAEIAANWGGGLSIESHTRFGPVVVLELPKALPNRGGQNHNEEQWGEVRKSA